MKEKCSLQFYSLVLKSGFTSILYTYIFSGKKVVYGPHISMKATVLSDIEQRTSKIRHLVVLFSLQLKVIPISSTFL